LKFIHLEGNISGNPVVPICDLREILYLSQELGFLA
jgi:hypothetical protein